jgi:hypothetical protein
MKTVPALSLLDTLAERQIAAAQARGEFDALPGSGMPLELGDDALVPEELRAAYRLLRNAGCIPQEISHCREIRDIETLLRNAETGEERRGLLARLQLLLERGSLARRGRSLQFDEAYYARLGERLARTPRSTD